MTEKYETYAYFYVKNFEGDYSEINEKLKIEPTTAWHKGDECLLLKRIKSFSTWAIYSPLNRSEIFLNVHVEAVLNIIEPKISEILELKKQGCEIGINCVGYYTNSNPGFGLTATIISRLAKFSMDLDFDLYCSCTKMKKTKVKNKK